MWHKSTPPPPVSQIQHPAPPVTTPVPTPPPPSSPPPPVSPMQRPFSPLPSILFSIQNEPFRFPNLRTPSPSSPFTETPLPRTPFPFPYLWTPSPSSPFTEAPLPWTPFPFPGLWTTLPCPWFTFCEFQNWNKRLWKWGKNPQRWWGGDATTDPDPWGGTTDPWSWGGGVAQLLPIWQNESTGSICYWI